MEEPITTTTTSEDYSQEFSLSELLAAHTRRLDRIESKVDDANNRLAILLELLRP